MEVTAAVVGTVAVVAAGGVEQRAVKLCLGGHLAVSCALSLWVSFSESSLMHAHTLRYTSVGAVVFIKPHRNIRAYSYFSDLTTTRNNFPTSLRPADNAKAHLKNPTKIILHCAKPAHRTTTSLNPPVAARERSVNLGRTKAPVVSQYYVREGNIPFSRTSPTV